MADKKKSNPFNSWEYNKLLTTIGELRDTQVGSVAEPLTKDELLHLFVPQGYREPLTMIYQIEEKERAIGNIFVDMAKLCEPVMDNPPMSVSKAVFQIYFNRDTMPDGFITPGPMFGTKDKPLRLSAAETALEERFQAMTNTMAAVEGEWNLVEWVLGRLYASLNTVQQVRYVWPAIYTLVAQTAGWDEAYLAHASSRAGINAVPDPEIIPYIRPSYDVVSRSVLLGKRTDLINRARIGQVRLISYSYKLTLRSGEIAIGK